MNIEGTTNIVTHLILLENARPKGRMVEIIAADMMPGVRSTSNSTRRRYNKLRLIITPAKNPAKEKVF